MAISWLNLVNLCPAEICLLHALGSLDRHGSATCFCFNIGLNPETAGFDSEKKKMMGDLASEPKKHYLRKVCGGPATNAWEYEGFR